MLYIDLDYQEMDALTTDSSSLLHLSCNISYNDEFLTLERRIGRGMSQAVSHREGPGSRLWQSMWDCGGRSGLVQVFL
jgi:hypothetical protein